MSKFKDALDRIKHIAEALPDDDPDKLEMMNVEGDYSNLMEWALTKRNEAIEFQKACKELQAKYSLRAESFSRKADSMKEVCGLIMGCANERKYKGASGTVGFRSVPPSVIIIDESKIPDEFKKTTVSVDKTLLKKALKDGAIDGAELSNGGETIGIRC